MSMYPQSGMNTLDYGHAETGERSRLMASFFNQVYLWMAVGLMWTAVVSATIANVPALQPLTSRGIGFGAFIAAFLVAMGLQRAALRLSVGAGLACFILYATLIGVGTSYIWLAYQQSTIGAAFLLTGGLFAVMSIIGFVTKIDLSRIGSIAIMIAVGLFIASIVNFFITSDMISWIITYAIVIIFPVIIARQTQFLKEFVLEHGENGALAQRMAVIGALVLYISFINIFLAILRILGDRD